MFGATVSLRERQREMKERITGVRRQKNLKQIDGLYIKGHLARWGDEWLNEHEKVNSKIIAFSVDKQQLRQTRSSGPIPKVMKRYQRAA